MNTPVACLLISFFGLVISYPHGSDGDAKINSQYQFIHSDGTYEYGYETSNGIDVQETGNFEEDPETKNLTLSVNGLYRYVNPEGDNFEVNYQADKRGFYPVWRIGKPSRLEALKTNEVDKN